MKTLFAAVCILAILCSSALAATAIGCVDIGSQRFTISYVYMGTESFPRAFALDVTASGGQIAGVTAAKIGESTSASTGFGIFPGTIVIDSAGSVTNAGSPVAPNGDTGSLTGASFPMSAMTLELGSLYATGGQPFPSGILVAVQMSGIANNGSATVSISPNMTRRGVVLEDGTSIGAFTSTCVVAGPVLCCADDCFCNTLSTYARWTLSGKPSCWCPPKSVTGLPTGGSGYQCVGDAAQDRSSAPNYYRIYNSDLTAISNSWKKKIGDPGYNACADIAHDQSAPPNYYGVYNTDVTRLSYFWKKTDSQFPPDLPKRPDGSQIYCGQCDVPPAYK